MILKYMHALPFIILHATSYNEYNVFDLSTSPSLFHRNSSETGTAQQNFVTLYSYEGDTL